jgi:hypothetical protein
MVINNYAQAVMYRAHCHIVLGIALNGCSELLRFSANLSIVFVSALFQLCVHYAHECCDAAVHS